MGMNILRKIVIFFGLGFSCVLSTSAASDYTPYHHIQWKWPTASGGSHVSTKYAVPVYFALPERPYTILGSMNKAPKLDGDALIQYEARKAKEVGGDAIIVQIMPSTTKRLSDIDARGLGSTSGDRFGTWFGNAFPAFSGASALVIKFK